MGAGRQQAKELAERLRNEPIQHIISSPFIRCVETASIVSSARQTPLPINIEPGICEVLYDYPPGYLSISELHRLFPLVTDDYEPVLVPNKWEPTSAHCVPRVTEALRRLQYRFTSSSTGGAPFSLLLVTHGAPIAAIVSSIDSSISPRVGIASLSLIVRYGDERRWRIGLMGCFEHITDRSNLRAYW